MAKKVIRTKQKQEPSPREINVKALLVVTALLEGVTGVVMILFPVFLSRTLFGLALDEPVGTTITRIGGAAIFSLGAACWLLRADWRGNAGKGVITAMAIYHTVIMMVVFYAVTLLDMTGPSLWMIILEHSLMAGWCIRSLLNMNKLSVYRKLFGQI